MNNVTFFYITEFIYPKKLSAQVIVSILNDRIGHSNCAVTKRVSKREPLKHARINDLNSTLNNSALA